MAHEFLNLYGHFNICNTSVYKILSPEMMADTCEHTNSVEAQVILMDMFDHMFPYF